MNSHSQWIPRPLLPLDSKLAPPEGNSKKSISQFYSRENDGLHFHPTTNNLEQEATRKWFLFWEEEWKKNKRKIYISLSYREPSPPSRMTLKSTRKENPTFWLQSPTPKESLYLFLWQESCREEVCTIHWKWKHFPPHRSNISKKYLWSMYTRRATLKMRLRARTKLPRIFCPLQAKYTLIIAAPVQSARKMENWTACPTQSLEAHVKSLPRLSKIQERMRETSPNTTTPNLLPTAQLAVPTMTEEFKELSLQKDCWTAHALERMRISSIEIMRVHPTNLPHRRLERRTFPAASAKPICRLVTRLKTGLHESHSKQVMQTPLCATQRISSEDHCDHLSTTNAQPWMDQGSKIPCCQW